MNKILWMMFEAAAQAPAPAPSPDAGIAWDPVNKGSNYTLSDDNHTASTEDDSTELGVVSPNDKSSGKWQFEFKWTPFGGNNFCAILGVCSSGYNPTTEGPFAEDGSSTFFVVNNEVADAATASYDLQADTWAWGCVDATAQKFWVGDSRGAFTGDPVAGTSPVRGTGSTFGDLNLGGGAVRILGYCLGEAGVPGSVTIRSPQEFELFSGYTAWEEP